MSEQFNSIMEGLNDLLEYTKGDKTKARSKIVTVPDVKPLKLYTNQDIKTLRANNHMTQKVFAELLGVTPKAVQAWEKGTNKPTGSAIRLLQLLEEDSKNVLDTILIYSSNL